MEVNRLCIAGSTSYAIALMALGYTLLCRAFAIAAPDLDTHGMMHRLGQQSSLLSASLHHIRRGNQLGSTPVGREIGHGIAPIRQAQAGAHQAVEGLLELAVGHAGAAKGDAPNIRVGVLNRRPRGSCMQPQGLSTLLATRGRLQCLGVYCFKWTPNGLSGQRGSVGSCYRIQQRFAWPYSIHKYALELIKAL